MREFRTRARTGKIRVWRIDVEGDQVITEYGELGGKMQRVTDTAKAKNVGRSNEVSAEDSAVQLMEREILLKRRGGYRELGEEERKEEIDFKNLPLNLQFYKPDNSLSKTLLKKLEEGKTWFSRKRDGEMMVIVFNEGGIDIYSRKMLKSHHLEDVEWALRFPELIYELGADYSDIPDNTILLGEMVVGIEDDNRWALASIMKSKTREAIDIQDREGPARFYCWDIAFWDGEDWVSTQPVKDRYEMINRIFKTSEFIIPVDYLTLNELQDEAHNLGLEVSSEHRITAMDVAKELDWEGWVIVDPDGVFGDKAYNFRGKVDRPGKFSGKLKPEFEDDFIALWDPDGTEGLGKYGRWGRGKRQGQVGSVQLFQYDSRSNLVYICDCGGGLIKTDAFAEAHSNPGDYPMVLKVLYTGRTYTSDGEKTNALQFPRVIEVRTDKSADECINGKL